MPHFFSKNKLFLFCLAGWFLFFFASNVLAAGYELEVKLPGMPDSVSDPGAYMRYLFIFGVSLAGFLAVGMIIYGGVKYMLAASVGSTQDAKDKILGALGGVALILCSYLLLYTIDPSLTNLSPLPVSQIMAADVEAPSPQDSGLTEATTATATGTGELACKTNKICQDIESGKVSSTLTNSLRSLPVEVTVTETTGSHGCASSDSCVSGAACGTSTHCSGNAADIRVSNLTTEQKKEVMQSLSQNKCVDQLFYSGFPEYCKAGGGQNASKSKSCSAHSDHIHYSVKSGCT